MEKQSDYLSLLQRAIGRRESIASRNTAYRLVNGASDGFPGMTLDRYGSHYQIQFFGAELLPFRRSLVEAVVACLEPEFLVTKFRMDPNGESLESPRMEVEVGRREDSATVVQEGDCLFHVDLMDTVNPGLFLDMREGREDVERRAAGKSILNLFSYTCSFGVHARSGGASRTVNVDISARILEKGRENYALNGLPVQSGEFFHGAAKEYLDWAARKGVRFGGIVLDPPSFARHKGTTFRVRENLQDLVALSAGLLEPGGFFLVSSNYSGFSPKSLAAASLTTVSGIAPGARLAWAHGQGPDFPGSGSRKESSLSAALILV